jgi:uncharacterized protein YbjT (DUF2867 family)
MAAPILVTGGTGTLGRILAPRLREAGQPVRVLSRTSREAADGIEYVTGDLATGEGADRALDGTETVVHLAGTATGDEVKARHLVRAAAKAGVRHLVYISVVGADRVPVKSRMDRAMFGYFASKYAAEQVLSDSGLPWTTLRATQFHEAMFKTFRAMAKSPVIPVPSGFRFQPVDGTEVAERLAELALGSPAGLVPDLAGPRVYGMDELLRSYLRAVGKHRLLLPVRTAGQAARAYRDGANLPLGPTAGRRTWEDFLEARLAEPSVA